MKERHEALVREMLLDQWRCTITVAHAREFDLLSRCSDACINKTPADYPPASEWNVVKRAREIADECFERVRSAFASRCPPEKIRDLSRHAPCHRFLIVDGDRDHADVLAQILEMDGHEVTVAYDGQKALAVAEEMHPDAILLDIELPSIGGTEVAQQLRQRPWAADLLIVAVSAWLRPSDLDAARAAGFDAYLAKPYSHEMLLNAIGPCERRPFFVRL